MCPTIARIAFATYLLKLTGTGRNMRRFLWFVIITQLAINIFTMIEILVSCKQFEMLWNPNMPHECWSPTIQAYIGFFQGAWNSLNDLVLTFLPWIMLKDLQMEPKSKVALSILMGLSIFAMVACIVKTVQLKVLATRDDFTYTVSSFIIWFTIENYVVIIAASIPTLRPLILKIMKMHAHRRSQSSSAQNPSLPPYTAGHSWTSRPNPVRLHSARKSSEKWDVEPPYIHPKLRKPPPPGTIRKTVSIYISSGSDCEDIEFQNLGVGVHTRISAGGRSRNTTAEDEGWRITRTSGGSRPASGIKTDEVGVDVDLERQ